MRLVLLWSTAFTFFATMSSWCAASEHYFHFLLPPYVFMVCCLEALLSFSFTLSIIYRHP
jgi:hypothetical protein